MMTETKPTIHVCECEICKTSADVETVRSHRRINLFLSRLTEPQRRWYVATLSEEADNPGDRQLSLITGLDEKTIRRGKEEMGDDLSDIPSDRQRREGGGRLQAEKKTRS
jgi:hypothetical protein